MRECSETFDLVPLSKGYIVHLWSKKFLSFQVWKLSYLVEF